MTKDDIIRMAREAGFVVDELSQQQQPNCIFHTWHLIDEGLVRFAALVAAAKAAEHQQTLALQQRSYEREIEIEVEAEREACAKVCEAEGQRIDASWVSCAAAIRARNT